MPLKAITLTQDATLTGGLCLVGIEPVRNSMLLEQEAQAREHDTWHRLLEQARAGLDCRVMQSTSDVAPGLLASVAQPLGAHHAPDLFPVQPALSKAVAAPLAVKQRAAYQAVAQAAEMRKRVPEPLDNPTRTPAKRGPGRLPKAAACLGQGEQAVETARHEPQRRAGPRETVPQSLRAIGHASHCVDLERGVRRNGTLQVGDIQRHIDTLRTMAQHEPLSETGLARLEKAERVVPKMQATIEFVSDYGRQQVRQLDLAQPASYAMHVHLLPSYDLDRVASTRTVPQGEALRALAERLRTPLFESGDVLGALSPMEQHQLKPKAKTLAEVLQRSSSNVEGRNGSLSLRHHPLRGLDPPRKRTCLKAIHHFFLTRADGTTVAERFCGQKPRSMVAAILEAVESPPAPLSPPRRALG